MWNSSKGEVGGRGRTLLIGTTGEKDDNQSGVDLFLLKIAIMLEEVSDDKGIKWVITGHGTLKASIVTTTYEQNLPTSCKSCI